ncbi:hypothetical protein MD484_g8072, partial [Candolleomyces efflorescens]
MFSDRDDSEERLGKEHTPVRGLSQSARRETICMIGEVADELQERITSQDEEICSLRQTDLDQNNQILRLSGDMDGIHQHLTYVEESLYGNIQAVAKRSMDEAQKSKKVAYEAAEAVNDSLGQALEFQGIWDRLRRVEARVITLKKHRLVKVASAQRKAFRVGLRSRPPLSKTRNQESSAEGVMDTDNTGHTQHLDLRIQPVTQRVMTLLDELDGNWNEDVTALLPSIALPES